MEEDLCRLCQKRPTHGYVNGTGEYLKYTCLKCHRRSRKQPNYIEGGTARTYSKTPSCGNREDK